MSEAMAQGMLDMMLAKNEGPRQRRAADAAVHHRHELRQWCEDVLRPAVLA